jgi:hypothetical protein
MHRSLRLGALLFASVSADEACLEEESSLLQEAPARNKRNGKPLTGLLESARGFLTNGATPDVVTFAQQTLDEVALTIIPTLENESAADQAWMRTEWARFQGAIDELVVGNTAVHQWNAEEVAASSVHKTCRDLQKIACDGKRDCEMELYRLWLAWVQEETQLREIHEHIEHHFCEQDEHGNFIANGTLHTFRVASVPWMQSYTEQKTDCDNAEGAYDLALPECVLKHGELDHRSALCNANLDDLEGKACAHDNAIADNLRLFHNAWASLHASYQGITDLVYNQTQDRHEEYKTLVIVQCLLGRVRELNGRPCDETTNEANDEMTTCEQQGDDLVICTERPSLCPTYDPPPATPPDCADRHSVVGACLPTPQPKPCGNDWIAAEMTPLPALPVPAPEFNENNPGCNAYPECSACSLDDDLVLPALTNYQTWVAAPASFELSHATFSAAAEDYADRNSLWGVTVDGCSSDNSNGDSSRGDQSGQMIPRAVHSADEHAAVRCCSHDGNSCESDVQGVCYDFASLHDAAAICRAANMRLCSEAEMDRGVCCGTGCWFNHYAVWVSDGTGDNDLQSTRYAAGVFRE